jgi:hypothetical protein
MTNINDRPVVSDMLIAIIGATASGLLVGIVAGISIMWLSTAGGN